MMGGDLISDGGAEFWRERSNLIVTIPKFRNELLNFLDKHENTLRSRKPQMYDEVIKCVSRGHTGEINIPGIAYASSTIMLASMLTFSFEPLYWEYHQLQ